MSRHQRKPDSSCDSSNTTMDAIREVCECADKPVVTCISHPIRVESACSRTNDCCPPKCRYDPGAFHFNSVITPVTNLQPGYSGCQGCVEFRMRRKNKTVTLQWEPFTGAIGQSGISFLTVVQSICNTPPYKISIPIYFQYKGTNRITHIDIDPNSTTGNVFFYLNTDGSTSGITIGDSFSVPAGAVSWITD